MADTTTTEPTDAPYRSLIGCLMYASVCTTRPDITTSVNKLGSFLENPSKQHWLAAKRVLRYVKGTAHLSLTYTVMSTSLTFYVDADWVGDTETQHSTTTGLTVLLGNTKIQWSSYLSPTEAEHIAITQAIHQECIWVQQLLEETTLQSNDNRGAQFVAHNMSTLKRSKHIDIKFHFIREKLL